MESDGWMDQRRGERDGGRGSFWTWVGLQENKIFELSDIVHGKQFSCRPHPCQ